MIATFNRMLRSSRGAGAAEFALVLPLLLLLLFGIIDTGRFMWELNRGEKAAQVGARVAIVTDPVSTGLVDADFATGGLGLGDLIPASALGSVTCTSTTCSCGAGACPITNSSVNSAAFTTIVTRMNQIDPQIEAGDVRVIYRGSGFGFAGGDGGAGEKMEISPLVTVSLTDLKFHPITCLLFICEIDMPSFATTLTSEDASGTFSN